MPTATPVLNAPTVDDPTEDPAWTLGTADQAVRYLAEELPGLGFDFTDAASLDAATKKLYRCARNKLVPCFHLGREVRFRRSDLAAWIANGGTGYQKHVA